MRKFIAAAFLLIGYNCFAQCPFTVTLKNKGSLCLGSDTLVVSSASNITSIKWYKDGVLDTVVNGVVALNGYNQNAATVAGGNGQGNATNQTSWPNCAMLDLAGNLYVAESISLRISKFPSNSTSATFGTIAAGGNGTGNAANQFYNLFSMYVDGAGNIYANDEQNHRIQKFPPNSSGTTNGVTVADGNGTANRFTSDCVFVDAAGYIYVGDFINERILRFPPNSNSTTIGVTVAGGNGIGSAANQFNGPSSIFIDASGYMYVADLANNRVQKFPPNSTGATSGVTVAGGNGKGAAANQLNNPQSVFIDGSGNLFILDYFNYRVQKFPANSTGATLGVTVAGGNGEGGKTNQISAPGSIFLDGAGNIYVADGGNSRVQKFSPGIASTMDVTRIPSAAGNYYAIVTDASGCTVTTNSIAVYAVVTPTVTVENSARETSPCTLSNNFSFSALVTDGSYVNAPVYQWQVNGVKAGVNNRTFTSTFADKDVVTCIYTSGAGCPTPPTVTSKGYIVAFGSPSAATLKIKGSVCLGNDTLVISSANKLAGIKWYKDGLVDTTLTGKIIAAGKALTVAGGLGVGTANNQTGATGVFVQPDGTVFETEGLGGSIGGRVLKFPSNSSIGTNGTIVAGSNGIGNGTNQLQSPNGVAIDKNGYLYVVDYNSDRVIKFPPGSTNASNGVIVAGGNGTGLAANQLNKPWAIAVDGNNNVYVADRLNNRIQKFPPGSTSATNGITVAGGNGAGAAANQLNSPTSVSIDASDNLYVGEYNNYRIQKFPSGSNSATNGVTVAGGNGSGSALNQIAPFGSSLDKYGNLYVCDLPNYRVLEFPAGSTSATKGVLVMGGNGYGPAANQLSFVAGVAVDSAGNIYGADNFNYRIQKSAPILSTIDSFRIPTAAGTYYAVATDTTGCSITTNAIVISAPSTPTINISTYGSASICLAANTINYVAYSANGGTTPAYQWQVNGINAGTNSNIFSASLAYKDVVSCVLTSNATCATSPTVASNNDTINFGKPVTVVLNNKGNVCTSDTLAISSSTKPYVIQWYKDGVLDTTLQITNIGYATNGITVAGGNGRGKAANQFLGSTSMALDAMGNIYADDSYLNARVLKFPPNSSSATFGTTVVDGSSTSPFTVPFSASIDLSGNIFAIDGTQRVLKLTPGASTNNNVTVAGGNGNGAAANQFRAYAACLDGAGNIYVADFGNQRILKFPLGSTSATNGIIVAGGNGIGSAANQLNQPYSVAVDNSGNIYVADYGNNRIQKFPPNSSTTSNGATIAGGNGVGAAANQFSGPIWVSLDTIGNVFVADQINNRIQKFPPNSTSAANGVTVAGGNGPGLAANQLAQPSAVVVDAAGNIFVSDYQNYRIQKFLVRTSSIDTTYIPRAAGSYKAVIADSAGCSFTTNAITINTTVKPIASITADKPSVCAGTTMGFMATATNTVGTPSYQWQINGLNIGTNNARYTSAALATGDAVTCIVTNSGSCAGVDTSNIISAIVNPLPVVGPATNVSISLGQSITLNIPVTGNISTYLWDPPTYLSNNTVVNPLASPEKTITYTLKVTSVDSCEASGAITVTVIAPISIATAFTPNGDGRNDVFYVLGGLAGDKVKDFSIFDRWGKRLFKVQNVLPNDQTFGWNGTYNGELQQPGSYVYVVTIVSASGKVQVYKGSVVLVR